MESRFLPYLTRTQFRKLRETNATENKDLQTRPSTSNRNLQENLTQRGINNSDISNLIDDIVQNLKHLKFLSSSLFENIETIDQNKIYLIYSSLEKFSMDLSDLLHTQVKKTKTIETFFSGSFKNFESYDNLRKNFTPVIDEFGKFYGTSKSSGFGAMIYKDNSIYFGDWENREKHGKGVYIWNDGAVFIGEFHRNKVKKGCMMYANQDSYEGHFNDNKKSGKGIYFFSSQKAPIKGIWEDGEIVQAQ